MIKILMAIGKKSLLVSKNIDTYDAIQAVIEWELPSHKKFSSIIIKVVTVYSDISKSVSPVLTF